MTTRKLATFLLIAAFALLGIFLVSSCRTVPKNRPVPVVAVPPTNPDIAPVRLPVTKAQSSVQRATVIVEKLVPAPGQEEQIAALRLELSTTAAELTEALSRIPLLQKQTDDLLAKWVEENARAASLYEQWHGEQERADKAVASMKRVSAERDVFIKLFAVAFTVAAMMALTPIIKVFGSGFGPLYGPWVHLGCFIGGSAIAYIGAVSLIRLLLRIFVVL